MVFFLQILQLDAITLSYTFKFLFFLSNDFADICNFSLMIARAPIINPFFNFVSINASFSEVIVFEPSVIVNFPTIVNLSVLVS